MSNKIIDEYGDEIKLYDFVIFHDYYYIGCNKNREFYGRIVKLNKKLIFKYKYKKKFRHILLESIYFNSDDLTKDINRKYYKENKYKY